MRRLSVSEPTTVSLSLCFVVGTHNTRQTQVFSSRRPSLPSSHYRLTRSLKYWRWLIKLILPAVRSTAWCTVWTMEGTLLIHWLINDPNVSAIGTRHYFPGQRTPNLENIYNQVPLLGCLFFNSEKARLPKLYLKRVSWTERKLQSSLGSAILRSRLWCERNSCFVKGKVLRMWATTHERKQANSCVSHVLVSHAFRCSSNAWNHHSNRLHEHF